MAANDYDDKEKKYEKNRPWSCDCAGQRRGAKGDVVADKRRAKREAETDGGTG